MEITTTAQTVLQKRYYLEGETKWGDVCNRVADCFGQSPRERDDFYHLMANSDFLPNSPALMNAGTSIKAYSACYVLPIHDSIDSIYKFYADAAKISKSGGGIGANFSELRAEDSTVSSTGGVASGPLSFMKVQNVSTDVIKQGGRRRGANMGILDCDHPDLEKFISIKDTKGELENFNLSVRLSDQFMEKALDTKIAFDNAAEKTVWNELCKRAWSSAEPGVLFGDTIERGNPVPHLGKLVATNPCGELPLLPYENCCLGSINLSHYVVDGKVDRDKLEADVRTATLFLNRILDRSILPISECQEAMEKTRKIGLGIMGLHDMLIQLHLPYDSQKARDCAGGVMKFIATEADTTSRKLGENEGFYTGYVVGKSPRRRNANLTTIAPTGTLSMIADCSSGCEPYYSVITKKTVLDGTEFIMVNKWFEVMLRESLTNSIHIEGEIAFTRVLDAVKEAGTVMVDGVPSSLQQLFKSAEEIAPRDHVLMQAALQKYVDSSISKTINMPNNATIEDVKGVYELAYRTGCKGVTVYRDGSRAEQVLSTSNTATVGAVQSRYERGSVGTGKLGDTGPCAKAELPDTLEATRYRVKVGDQKVYIIICGDKTGPKEVFAKFPYTRDTNWNTLCRSISLSLRYGIPLKEVIKQLEKSIQQINDIPSQLARILKTYLSASGVSVSSPCPECGGELIFQEGCHKCGCGYSKCG